jgi:hypothetical protein
MPSHAQTKKNLILDMDETLLHCMVDIDTEGLAILQNLVALHDRVYPIITRDIFSPRGSDKENLMFAVERPYLQPFLQYINAHFDNVIIWSAGQRDYVYENIAHITRWTNAVSAVYHYEDCAVREDGTLTKPLAKIMADIPGLTLKNTFIVDDRETAFILENPNNGILIPAYEPSPNDLVRYVKKTSDPCCALLELIRYFERPGVLTTSDVTTLNKDIFGATNIPKQMGRAYVYETSGDGDCLFSAINICIRRQPILVVAAEERLNFKRATDVAFRGIISQLPPQSVISASYLRALVVSQFISDKPRREAYIETNAVMLQMDPTDQDVQWIRPALRPDGSFNEHVFYNLLVSRKSYWGDGAAMEIIGQQLMINIKCWKKEEKLRAIYSFDHPNAIGSINLLLMQRHYQAMYFDFTME